MRGDISLIFSDAVIGNVCKVSPVLLWKNSTWDCKTSLPFIVWTLRGVASTSVALLLLLSSPLFPDRFKWIQPCQEQLTELSYLCWADTPVPLISIQIQFLFEKEDSLLLHICQNISISLNSPMGEARVCVRRLWRPFPWRKKTDQVLSRSPTHTLDSEY